MARILRSGGVYFCISLGIPAERMSILTNQDYSWTVEKVPLTKPVVSEVVEKHDPENEPTSCYWLYICKTGGDDEEG